jgi:MoaA/NifB/PqqE/SkfB family radical SAM enzyme
MLPDWAAKVRESGCTVGMTTNGDLLDSASLWILQGNVDLLTISVAGTGTSNGFLRDGAQFDQLIDAAGELKKRSREAGHGMKVQLSYLMTRSNACELPNAVNRAAESDLDAVFVIHLDCWISRHQFISTAGFHGTSTTGLHATEKT